MSSSTKLALAATVTVTLAGMAVKAHAAPISLTGTTAYSQNFDALNGTDTSTSFYPAANASLTVTAGILPNGWSILENAASATNSNQVMIENNGSVNNGDTYLFGSGGSTERALGGAASGPVQTSFGAYFQNNTGSTMTAVTISFTSEQWRNGGNTSTQALFFDYSTTATALPSRGGATATATAASPYTDSAFTVVSALNAVASVVGATAASLDGNSTSNKATVSATISGLSVANGGSFFIRWQDVNDASNDHGIAVDSFSLTPTLAPAGNTITLTNGGGAGSGTDKGDITTTGSNGSYFDTSIAGSVGGATSGYVDILGTLVTPDTDGVLVAVDFTGSPDLSAVTFTGGGGTPAFTVDTSPTSLAYFNALYGTGFDAIFKFNDVTSLGSGLAGNLDFGFSLSGLTVERIAAIPEPGTWLASAVAGGMLLLGRRRRTQA